MGYEADSTGRNVKKAYRMEMWEISSFINMALKYTVRHIIFNI